jgi:hypothetical protein
VLDFGDGGPVIKVMGSFAEGMIGRGRTLEEVKEPWGHGLGNFFVEVIGGEEEVNHIGFLVVVLTDKEADMTVRAELDPLGFSIVSVTDGDLGRDLSSIVLVTVGSDGKLKLSISFV